MLKSFTRKQKSKSTSSPSKFVPKQYQIEGIKWLLQKPRSGLFWDPGLGKTITVLMAFRILREKGMAKRMLVVTKKKIANQTWPEEIDGWFLPFTYARATGSKKRRIAALESDADVVMINNENIAWAANNPRIKKLIRNFDVLVVDESSKYRSQKTQRFKGLKKLLKYFNRRYILTGTPAPKGLLNLFSQMFIVDQGEALGQWFGSYRNKYFVPQGYEGMKWVPRDENAANQIYNAIADKVLRASDKLLNLPEIIPVNRVIKLSPEARMAYDEMEREFIIEWQEHTVTAFNAGVKTQKLRQIANGAVYASDPDGPRVTVEIHDAKIQDLIDLYEESQGVPLLVNYEFDHDRSRIQRAFAEHEDKLKVPAIYGGTSDAEADRLKHEWNAGRLPVLLSQGDTISHGLNMQKTKAHIVFFGIPWDLEVYIQFIRRVRRQGYVGGGAVMVYHLLVEDSVDWVALRGAEMKDKEQNALFKALEERYGGRSMVNKRTKKKKRKTRGVVGGVDDVVSWETRGALSEKDAMRRLSDTILEQGRKPPRFRLHDKDPVSDFTVRMYAEIARWPDKHLAKFIQEVTGEPPPAMDTASMLGEVKRLFHEMFTSSNPEYNDPKHYASVWKMWPHVRRKRNEKEDKEEIEMAIAEAETRKGKSKFSRGVTSKKKSSKKAASKKAASKKATTKKASTKKAPAKKAAAKKANGKASGKLNLSRIHLDESAKLTFVKDPKKAGARQELADAVKLKSVKTLGQLIAKMEKDGWDERTTRNYTNKLIRGGSIKVS